MLCDARLLLDSVLLYSVLLYSVLLYSVLLYSLLTMIPAACSATRDFSKRYDVMREAAMKPEASSWISVHLPG